MNLIKLMFAGFIIGLLFAFFVSIAFPQNFPKATGYVNDYANIFTPSQKDTLESAISKYEKQTSIEISVVTVSDIQEIMIEEYATKLFNTWGIGKKQSDAGILIFLSLDTFDRGLRIEVGYGLEEFLTDYNASCIIDDVMPLLKNGDYAFALINATEQCINKIGDRSKESRAQYLKELEIEEAKRKETTTFILILSVGIIAFVIFIYFIYKAYRKRKRRLEREKRYFNTTKANLASLESVYDDTVEAVELLSKQQFHNADEVLRTLQKQESIIKTELNKKLNTTKKHQDVVKISDEIEVIGNKLKNSVTEIFENHHIETSIRGKLETQVEDLKRKIVGAMPQAKKLIDIINSDNSESIWRGFDYKNLDKNVESSFDKSEQAVKNSIKQLDSYMYLDAKQSAESAIRHMNNALKYVQSIYDVNQQINNGKEKYNQYISKLPDMIETTNRALQRNHVRSSTQALITDIRSKYGQLQVEIKKGNKLDWILIGAIIFSIVSGCDSAVRQSSKDIRNYEKEEERKRRRKREEEESRRSSYISNRSSYNGGESGFGGFGGGYSGGGGSTRRF